jgi:PST family polysaccharide transporter
MSLVKTSLLNGIAVVVKLASALVLNKILAVYVGPAGYAIIGQFQNVVSIVVNLAGSLLATGVTKTTAQHFDNEERQHEIWQTAIRFSLGATLLASIIIFLTKNILADSILHMSDMKGVFVWVALILPAMTANNLLLAILNGKKEIKIYVSTNIIASLISVMVTGLMAYNFGLYGALVAFAINPAIVLISTALLLIRCNWFKLSYLWGGINRPALHELSGYGLMSLTSILAMPITYMLIRDHLVNSVGLTSAGYWQASWKISEIFLMLITTTLSVYYLPRLAEIKTAAELKIEIFKVYNFVMPVIIFGAIIVYFLRDFIIEILFTNDFTPMRELFIWQLGGDVIKIASWVLGYVMLGRAMVKFFVLTEIAFSLSFLILSKILIDGFGLIGVSIAYAVNYTFHLICMIYLVKNEIRRMELMDDK